MGRLKSKNAYAGAPPLALYPRKWDKRHEE